MTRKTLSAVVLTLILALSFPADLYAGKKVKKVKVAPKKKVVVVNRHKAKPRVIAKLPGGHTKVMLHKNAYFFHAGAWYRHGPNGYTIIKAPIGARIRVLPIAYTTVVIGSVTYYHYYGTYYRLDPETREYCVVDAPEKVPQGDVIRLIDGEILEGRYLGGNEETVEFQVGDEVHEIDAAEIVSIKFEPPSD